MDMKDVKQIIELQKGIKDYKARTADLQTQLDVLTMICDHLNPDGTVAISANHPGKDDLKCHICGFLWDRRNSMLEDEGF